jgi:hypothetical protein
MVAVSTAPLETPTSRGAVYCHARAGPGRQVAPVRLFQQINAQVLLALVLTFALILLNGCGTGDKLRARKAMEASRAAYEKCLQQNPPATDTCESLKRQYEADRKAYRQATQGDIPTATIFMELRPGK